MSVCENLGVIENWSVEKIMPMKTERVYFQTMAMDRQIVFEKRQSGREEEPVTYLYKYEYIFL